MYHYKIFVKYYCAGTPTGEIKPIWKIYHQPFNEQLQVQLEYDLTTNECICAIESIEFLGQSNEICHQAPASQQLITPIATYSTGCINDKLPTPTPTNDSKGNTFRIA